jgi:hypothetical protein
MFARYLRSILPTQDSALEATVLHRRYVRIQLHDQDVFSLLELAAEVLIFFNNKTNCNKIYNK